MTGNHWTVFNGAGAVVADNMPMDVAQAYLTPERAERGWTAVYCVIVCDPSDFPDDQDDESLCPECKGDGGDKWNDYCLPCPTCGGDGRLW